MNDGFEFKWALAWGIIALIVWIYGGPVWIPLIIGGLAVPVVFFND